MPRNTVDVAALYASLDSRREGAGLTWRELGDELAITPSTFSRMASGKRPDADTFATIVNWLGLPAETFLSGRRRGRNPRTGKPRQPGDPLQDITVLLRDTLPTREAEAMDHLIRAAYKVIVGRSSVA